MSALLEFGIALIITMIFIRIKKPKLKFLFFGYLFFLVSLVFQLPFRILEVLINNGFFGLLNLALIPILSILVSELTKYFSLKNFLNTKNYRNGMLFVIGWVTFESITAVSIFFYSALFYTLNMSFDANFFASQELFLLSFLFFFIVNLAASSFIVKSIIEKNYFYLILGIFFSICIYLGLIGFSGIERLFFMIVSFILSILIVFFSKDF